MTRKIVSSPHGEKRIALRTYALDKRAKRNFGMDMGGGSGRLGTRTKTITASKSERLS